jgi:hypothetical protein
MQDLAQAEKNLDLSAGWVFARVRNAARVCPNRRSQRLSRTVFDRHYASRHRHHRRTEWIHPELYSVVRAKCVNAFYSVHHLAHYLHTSFYRIMTPARVDPLYHVTMGKCHHFESKKAQKRCGRLRMLRKKLRQHRRLLSRLTSGRHPHLSKNVNRARTKHLFRAISSFQKALPKVARSLATLQVDINRLSKRLTGVKFEAPTPITTLTSEGEMANIRKHSDVSIQGSQPAHKSAANLAHLRTIVNRLRDRLPKLVERFRRMKYDIKRIRRHVARVMLSRRRRGGRGGGRRARHHARLHRQSF